MLDQEGSGELYLRDLKLEQNDWFYVGMADLTWSEGKRSDNANLFVGEDAAYDFDSSLEGRPGVVSVWQVRQRLGADHESGYP